MRISGQETKQIFHEIPILATPPFPEQRSSPLENSLRLKMFSDNILPLIQAHFATEDDETSHSYWAVCHFISQQQFQKLLKLIRQLSFLHFYDFSEYLVLLIQRFQ